jgi:hypothetical protein
MIDYEPLVWDLKIRFDLIGPLRKVVQEASPYRLVHSQTKELGFTIGFVLELLLENEQSRILVSHLRWCSIKKVLKQKQKKVYLCFKGAIFVFRKKLLGNLHCSYFG